jgi:hypothetical protein
MKKLIAVAILFSSLSASAGKYREATVTFTDGKTKTGLVESPFGGEYIYFKQSEDATVEKLDAATVHGILFTIDGKKYEYHQHKVYKGWGQTRMSSDPMWLEVVENGIATLYVVSSRMQGSIYSTTSAGFEDYYCFREGEDGAKLIAQVSTMNNNQTFRAKAPLYFADYPELAEKIKSKEYTWKDLTTVVKEYNKWATTKK